MYRATLLDDVTAVFMFETEYLGARAVIEKFKEDKHECNSKFGL